MALPVKVFVIHVKKGYEDRARHMEKMLGEMGVDFEYILDWDVPDLTDEEVAKYFVGHMGRCWPATSCGFKHLEVYQKMIRENIPYALVLEDDIFLKKNFERVFNAAFRELEASHGTEKPFWLSMEATAMGFVPRSIRRRGQHVYPGRFLQCTGCYLANISLARTILDTISAQPTDLPIDIYFDRLRAGGLFDAFWTYPVIAEQGSHMGKMTSAIGNSSNGRFAGLKRRLSFIYKEILYFFR